MYNSDDTIVRTIHAISDDVSVVKQNEAPKNFSFDSPYMFCALSGSFVNSRTSFIRTSLYYISASFPDYVASFRTVENRPNKWRLRLKSSISGNQCEYANLRFKFEPPVLTSSRLLNLSRGDERREKTGRRMLPFCLIGEQVVIEC